MITHKTVPLVIEKILALSIRTANYKPLSFQENCMKGVMKNMSSYLKFILESINIPYQQEHI